MKEITLRLHCIAEDGLPPEDGLVGQVAFIFDGCIVSGWPLGHEPGTYWEADSDVGKWGKFGNVTHWVEFPAPLCQLAPLRQLVTR